MGAYPENSRAGLEAALGSGVGGVEIDVRATRDQRIVLLHDRSLERTAADPRNIDEIDYADLAAVRLIGAPDDGAVLPLEEALALCAGRARLVIDVKQAGIAGALEAMLHAFADRTETWVWTHDPAIARECIDAMSPAIAVSLIVRPKQVPLWSAPEGIALAHAEGLTGLLFEHPYVDGQLIDRAHEAGVTLHCGRTNEPHDIARILTIGPASICSDFPERVIAALDAPLASASVEAAPATA
jgi:glycerophosphoryl diester phosphodiesterase